MIFVEKLTGFYLNNEKFDRIDNEYVFELMEMGFDTKEIQEEIVVANLGLVRYLIGKYLPDLQILCNNLKCTYDDFYSCGTYGLYKAVLTYDYKRQIKFATYASRVIYNEIFMYVRANKKHHMHNVQLEGALKFDDDDDGNDLTLLDIIPDDKFEKTDHFVEEEYNKAFIEEFQKALTNRQHKIIKLRYYGELTQKQISKHLGISQSYISRIENNIIAKGRKHYKRMEARL